MTVAAGLFLSGGSLLAHHSESAQFDITKPVDVIGVVKKVEWMNPHIWFYVDVKDPAGKVTTWGTGLARHACPEGIHEKYAETRRHGKGPRISCEGWFKQCVSIYPDTSGWPPGISGCAECGLQTPTKP